MVQKIWFTEYYYADDDDYDDDDDSPQREAVDGFYDTSFYRVLCASYYVETWLEYFWLSASMWMSFVVFIQIYKLLVANKRTKIYQPPMRKRVIIESTIVYAVSVAFATMHHFLMLWASRTTNWDDVFDVY